MRRIATIALVIGVVAVVVAVGAFSFSTDDGASGGGVARDRSSSDDDLTGAHVPPPGVLPGTLWVVSASPRPGDAVCQLRAIYLTDLTQGPPGLLEHCTLVDVSRDGRYAVTSNEVARLVLVNLEGRPEVVQDIGLASDVARGARAVKTAALEPDGSRVAWCSSENETTVLGISDGARTLRAGCDPRFHPSGQVATRTLPPKNDAVLLDGEPLLGEADFRRGLDLTADGEASLLAYDIGDDGSVATKVRRFLGQPQPTVQIWNDAESPSHFRFRGLSVSLQASGIELSPDATAVAFGWTALLAGVLDVTVDRMVLTRVRGPYSWSPDGNWLAIGEGSEVSIYARGGQAPVYSLPAAATALRWTE